MQQVPGQAGSREGEFFVPDLCVPWPVLMMVLLSQLMVLLYALAGSALPHFNWDLFATASLFVQWVVLVSAALLCQLRYPLGRLSLPLATLGSLALVLLVTAVSSVLALELFPQISRGVAPGWWLLRNLLVAAVVTGILLRHFYLQQQLRLREQLALQARLDSLRARIRPHFLFNTMNSIASLIMSRPEAAEQAVEDLSELLRASLKDSGQGSTVADELRLCELYLGIEQLRLGERLRSAWQVDPTARNQPMPGLLLQPLVENAISHGIAQLPEGGTITLSVHLRERRLVVEVENPVPANALEGSGHHMALANIRQRLEALYGSDAKLVAGPMGDHYRVELSYPLEPPL